MFISQVPPTSLIYKMTTKDLYRTFRTNPVIFRTNLLIFRTNPVIFRKISVIFRTNPVIYL